MTAELKFSDTSIKILFYNHTAKVSGAENVLRMLASRLPSEQFAPVIACPAGDMAEVMERTGIGHVAIPALEARFTKNPVHLARYLMSGLSTVRYFRRLLDVQQPDIIHANSVRADIVASLGSLGLKMPVVWHIHDILPPHPISRLVRSVASASPRNKLVAVSKATARAFRGSSKCPPLYVIYNGIDTNLYLPDDGAGIRLCHELGIPADTFVTCMVGQITRRKGQREMVDVFARVVQRVPNAVLLIAGAPLFNDDDRLYYEEIASTIAKLGLEANVRLLGSRSDVPALLNAADAVAVNSFREPFALVVVEALATGKPVVAPDIDGFPEIVLDHVTGFVTAARDGAAMADRLCELAANPELRASLGEQGRSNVVASFTTEIQAERFRAYYRSVLDSIDAYSQTVAVEG